MKNFLLFICLAVTVNAKILTYEVSTNYVLGDNDTKIEARKIALEQAKKLSLEQAGTYMEVKTVVKNGKLTTDEIKSFGASVLKTKIKNEKYSFDGNSPVIELLVESNIDMDILKKNIQQAKNNKSELKKRIKLQQENEKLLKEIKTLKNNYQNREKRNTLITKIEKNNTKLIKTFKKGSLFDLSNQFSQNTDNAIKKINSEYFNFIKNNIEISIEDVEVVSNSNNTSNVNVKIFWQIKNHISIIEMINEYMNVINTNNKDDNESLKNAKTLLIDIPYTKSKKIDNKKVFDTFLNKQVLIKVKLYDNVKYIPISSGVNTEYLSVLSDSFYAVRDYGNEKVLLSVSNPEYSSFISSVKEFKNIPNNVLKEIDNIHTELIITRPIFDMRSAEEKETERLLKLFH